MKYTLIFIILFCLLILGCSKTIDSPIPNVLFYPYEENSKLPAKRVFAEVNKWLGVKYKYGGNSSEYVDCSAFVRNVYWQLGWLLPRTTSQQIKIGIDVALSDIKIGDLLFFDTNSNGRVSHVGIYLGDKNFAHSSISKGVTINKINEKYYKRTFIGARRMVW